MHPARQFWTLFKFQLTANPQIWFYMLAFGCFAFTSYLPFFSFSFGLSSPFMAIIFIALLGMTLLAPEIFFGASAAKRGAYGSEFLVTRAVDRIVLARSKAVSLYLLALILPVLLFFFSLRDPDVRPTSFTKIEQAACLAVFPGSSVHNDVHGNPRFMVVPQGAVFVAAYHLWEALLAVAAVLVLVALAQLRFLKQLYWVFFAIPLTQLELHTGTSLTRSERLFFYFVGHQMIVWTMALLLLLLSHFIWERCFVRSEQ